MYLKLAIVFQLLWMLVSTKETAKAVYVYESFPNLINNEQFYKLDEESMRGLEDITSSQRGKISSFLSEQPEKLLQN